MPFACFPITIQSSIRLIDIGVQMRQQDLRGHKVCPFTLHSSPMFGQKMFLNLYQTLYSSVDEKPTASLACVDLAVRCFSY
jgi:hypothetical protein